MTVINIERCNDNDKSILSEVLSVTKYNTSDITYSKTVNKYLSRRYCRQFFHIVFVDFNAAADIADINIFSVHTEEHSKIGVFS